MVLLSDDVYRLRIELEDTMHNFLYPPFNYPQEIIDEIIDIVDRMECLAFKLGNVDFEGSFRY